MSVVPVRTGVSVHVCMRPHGAYILTWKYKRKRRIYVILYINYIIYRIDIHTVTYIMSTRITLVHNVKYKNTFSYTYVLCALNTRQHGHVCVNPCTQLAL